MRLRITVYASLLAIGLICGCTSNPAKVNPDYYAQLDSMPLISQERLAGLEAQTTDAKDAERIAFSSPRLLRWLHDCDSIAAEGDLIWLADTVCTLTDSQIDSLSVDEAIYFYLCVKESEFQNCSFLLADEWKWDIIRPTSFVKGSWMGQSPRQEKALERDLTQTKARVKEFLATADNISPDMLSLIQYLKLKEAIPSLIRMYKSQSEKENRILTTLLEFVGYGDGSDWERLLIKDAAGNILNKVENVDRIIAEAEKVKI